MNDHAGGNESRAIVSAESGEYRLWIVIVLMQLIRRRNTAKASARAP